MARALSWSDLDVHEALGDGHSAIVVRATVRRNFADLLPGAPVAVKLYKPWVLQQAGQIERIFREVEAGRTVEHPNLMKVYAAVLNADGRPALVMKLYDGPTLDRYRVDRPDLSLEAMLALARDVAAGVSALHDHEIIHRDLKPTNVIVTEHGAVVADFGVVRSAHLPEQTTTGAFLGTIRYAAPEYLFGDEYGAASDTYSFGAIAYELFTNTTFFDEHAHWARVVAAKLASPVTHIPSRHLRLLSDRFGFNAAEFLSYIVRHSCSDVGTRDLDLRSVIAAVDAGLWTGSFVGARGTLARGEKNFKGKLPTAAAASAAARKLTLEAYRELRRSVTEWYWEGAAPAFDIGEEYIAELTRRHLVRRDWSGNTPTVVFNRAVKEALALGLLPAS